MPIVRAVYEGALTAQWVADSREGLPAFLNHENDQRSKLADSMAKSVSEAFRDHAPDVARRDADRLDTIASSQAKYFQQRCLALERVGHDGYAIFRAMSNYSHPSGLLVDQYVIERPDTEVGIALRDEAEPVEHNTWLLLAVASMMWAARAVDIMDKHSPHRRYLRGIATRLGVPPELRLTPEARRAEAEAEQDRRRAQWKGAKPKARPALP